MPHAASSFELSRMTAEPLTDARVVVAVGAVYVRAARGCWPDDAELLLGVCEQSIAGDVVDVIRLGRVRSARWSFEEGMPVYCGLAGELTQHPPLTMAWWVRVGVATAPDEMLVDMQAPVCLR